MEHGIHARERGEIKPSTISPKKLAHIVIKTNNYTEMVNWYITVLGARIAQQSPGTTFLTYDDEHHRIGICDVRRLSNLDPNRSGVDHVAFTYEDMGSLLATYKRLAGVGILPRWSINHGVTLSFYYQDPDGNRLELQIDRFKSSQLLQDYFEHDPEYSKNPFGAPFDPKQLIADFERGVPFEQLIKIPAYPAGMNPGTIIKEMGLGAEPV